MDWPALLIGLLTGAYWARVIKLVFKTRRLTGKAGNFWPAEPLGRLLRVIWYPVVILWIAFPLYKAWASPAHPFLRPIYEQSLVRFSGVAVAIVAYWFTLVCWRKMGKSWRMGIDPGERTQLVVTGPYAYVRHPIYALQALMVIASFVAVPTPVMLVVALLLSTLLSWEAIREEKYLLQTHGEPYARYLANVGRFIPRPATASPAPAERT